MKDLKEYTAVGSVLLVGIGTVRLLLLGEHYNISLWSYISFSNVLAYTSDVIRGMIWYALPVMLFVSFKSSLTSWFFKGNIWWYIILTALSLGIAYYWYKRLPPTRWGIFWLKYVLLMAFFLLGVTVKKWDERVRSRLLLLRDFELVKLGLLIGFLYWYIKIDFNYTLSDIDGRGRHVKSMIVIKTAPGKFDTIHTDSTKYVILSTGDFVFLHNDSDRSTMSIPVANIIFNTTNITDTAKCK